MHLDLACAFLCLMLIGASGFGALSKRQQECVWDNAQCAAKTRVVSYADWILKGGATETAQNADGSGYYLHHEIDVGKISGLEGGLSVEVFSAQGEKMASNFWAQENLGKSGASRYCASRVALCSGEICVLLVCSYDEP